MWQLCGWGRVDICMTFHMRVFEFFYTELLKMTVVQVGVKTEYKNLWLPLHIQGD
jgi:hypothetical protein